METRVWTVPMLFAAWQALAGVAEFLPGTPLTRNQIALMKHDNIASDDLPGLNELSVTPTAVEAIVLQIAGGRPG
jgi:NADH dehydrogenase